MNEIEQLLDRQARWQQSRRALSWPEKIRMAQQVRASAAQWRVMAGVRAPGSPQSNHSIPNLPGEPPQDD